MSCSHTSDTRTVAGPVERQPVAPPVCDPVGNAGADERWICPYISRHLLSLNPLLACCRRYSRGER
ncbi:hypothetical protein GKN84_20570 [Shigella sonnei]|nr:hypothetical protein [Shigella sonnei]EFV7052064.1 hypothetical protein [Shigella sonnei]EFV7708734.1 hypothetical protein [Shigella sonnei]EFV7737797.1 hypothetical protein [Shigella sonnei]